MRRWMTNECQENEWSKYDISVQEYLRRVSPNVSVSNCCCNKLPQILWLKQREYITLCFWRWDVLNGSTGLHLSWRLQKRSFPCLLQLPEAMCFHWPSAPHYADLYLNVVTSPSLNGILPSSTFGGICDYIGLTNVIYDNLLISRSLINHTYKITM